MFEEIARALVPNWLKTWFLFSFLAYCTGVLVCAAWGKLIQKTERVN